MRHSDSRHAGGGAKSILLVDDDELNLQVVARRLFQDGYYVATANSGPAALETMNRQRFDLVLLDLEMPGMDGLETLKRIRALSSRRETPVIMLSAHNQNAAIRSCLVHGAADYLVKPLVMSLVRARIERHLAAPSRPGEPGAPEPQREVHILIVDDDDLSCRLLAGQLKSRGYAASTVTSGKAALERIGQAGLDVVLLDIGMPDVNGNEILKSIRANDTTKKLPVIMVTASNDVPTMLSCVDEGADGYVTKPVDIAYLHACILSSLEAKRRGPRLELD